MQSILPTNLGISAFAVTLPLVTIGTALLVFNLQTMVELWDACSQVITTKMRKFMYNYPRPSWAATAQFLDEDKELSQIPIKKSPRKSGHWVYVLFLIEFALFFIPLHELISAYHVYGLRSTKAQEVEESGVTEP